VVRPSGAQFEIRYGEQRAVVVAVGGGIRTYSVGDGAVLDGYDVDSACDGARGHTLVPWPNRVKDGRWSWRGADQQLALTEPEQHNAIHGLVRWVPWSALDHGESSVTVACTSYPQPGYPWTIDVRNTWSLHEDGLSVQTTIANLSEHAAPVAVGFHPYLTVGTATVDDLILTVPCLTRVLTGAQQIPTGREPVEGGPDDFRVPRRLGDLELDQGYADLLRDPDGRCRVRLADPERGAQVTFWADEAYPYLQLFTGDALPDPARRRRGLAVEPMSAPANALVTGEALSVVEPGKSWWGHWGINPF
jgi:aldose 1-epimerase